MKLNKTETWQIRERTPYTTNRKQMEMNPKQKRLEVLKKLIASNNAGNQDDILSMLSANGFVVTQATLSRDLKELKVAKIPDGKGGYGYRLSEQIANESARQPSPKPALSEMSNMLSGIGSVEFSGQIGVFHTLPGYANMIASVIDSGIGREVMGTIAGDDTIFLALRAASDIDSIMSQLEIVIPGISARRI